MWPGAPPAMAPLTQPFASTPGAEAIAIAAAKTAANIHFMTALRILETAESIRSGGCRSGLLRGRGKASVRQLRRDATAPQRALDQTCGLADESRVSSNS